MKYLNLSNRKIRKGFSNKVYNKYIEIITLVLYNNSILITEFTKNFRKFCGKKSTSREGESQ